MIINIPKLEKAGYKVDFQDKNRVLHIHPNDECLYNLSIDAMQTELEATNLNAIQIDAIITSYIETVHTFSIVNVITKLGD